MKSEVKVPSMGESISEATIGAILKPSGSMVAADDELLELETDKVNQVLYAPAAGIVTWNVKEEDVVKIGQVLGVVEESIDQRAKEEVPIKKEAPKQELPKSQKREEVPQVAKETVSEKPENPLLEKGARQSKEEYLTELEAPESRFVQREEITPRSTPESMSLEPSQILSENPSRNNRQETRKKMSKIRRVIARRLVEVQQQTAMLTTFNEVDMDAIISLRSKYKEAFNKKHDAKLGFMSFFVKASVSALKAFPEVNAYIDGEEIVTREYYDIGVAVGTEKGLFVPVIRSCDTLSFAGIEDSIEWFAKKAKEGKLSADELQGGGFTITNGGIFGSLLSTPILNPPQSAILGMHKIMKRAVVIDDQIVIRPMMYLALSYDHRLIDGKEAVSFLVHIKNSLEDPSRLLLDM